MPLTLAAPAEHELIVKKSRFLGRVEPCADRAAALARVAQLRAEHPGAAHVCWALLAGGHSAANDDGEPGGTAGRPMLDVLRHQGLDGVLATAVRYWGGVKLGAGGLVRAYTDCIAQALLTADKVERVAQVELGCELPYELEGRLRRLAEQHGAVLADVRHEARVHMRFSLPVTARAAFTEAVDEASQGRVGWVRDSSIASP
ncbi:YigZ family protein [Roseateles asaccharophilus]|uniref:YigZ family protein n=1 Tax=Roseateles asaccharophilus TaxID=582607 RepID=A0ABU2AFV9_9BURK|nr:YigZ family protein [Roseateles asaccharophilus]MDR7335352.1 putative YigZ family protein [Roseateles asaccharophilus]